MKALVIASPSEVSFGSSSQVTSDHTVLSVDIMECELKDVGFNTQFTLTSTGPQIRNMDAFLLHMEFEFGHCHTKPRLSTDPHARMSHWRQALYRMDSSVLVSFAHASECS